MSYRTLDDVDVSGKRVLVSVDFNVPLEAGRVTDTSRIERALPTVRALQEKGARVVLLSHFGRPKGKRMPEMSLAPVAKEATRVFGFPIAFAEDCIGEAAESAVAALKPSGVLLLENTRFHQGEEKNDPEFAKAIAKLGDLYVNDAFSASHRAHATTEAIAHLLPAYAGRAMRAELDALARALTHPARPVMAIVGGAKISTKLELLGNLIARVNVLVIGGGMANTFLAAQNIGVGKSLCEPGLLDAARKIMADAATRKCKILLPEDAVIARELKPGVAVKTVPITSVPADQMILDIGPKSVAAINAELARMKTLVWNGPVGAFETKPFDAATKAIAEEAARLTRVGQLVSVAGGGDTLAALNAVRVTDDFTYVSAAGGAFLEWLEGKELPGVKALENP